jgi:hypothetical protein
MTPGDHAVDREILVDDGEELCRAGGVSPVPHQVKHDGKPGDDVDTRVSHPVVGHIPDVLGRSARCFVVSEDGEASLAKREGKERRALSGSA